MNCETCGQPIPGKCLECGKALPKGGTFWMRFCPPAKKKGRSKCANKHAFRAWYKRKHPNVKPRKRVKQG